MDKEQLILLVLKRLKAIPDITAIVVGGSHAAGTNRPDSDIDLGLYYEESCPFSIESIKKLAFELNDLPNPIVSVFGGWGEWVNGGTWLTIKGQRLDLIFRSLDFTEKVIDDCIKGEITSDYYQEPPYGFHNFIYLAEIKENKILYDPKNVIRDLKNKVAIYPPKLKTAIINKFLWDTEFTLSRGVNFAARDEVYLASGSLSRITHDLIQVLYAINETYYISPKRIYRDINSFDIIPEEFLIPAEKILSSIGATKQQLTASLEIYRQLIDSFKQITQNIYVPKYK